MLCGWNVGLGHREDLLKIMFMYIFSVLFQINQCPVFKEIFL